MQIIRICNSIILSDPKNMSNNKTKQDILKQNGLKVTSTRVWMLKLFKDSHAPLNAEKLHKKMADRGADLATIYRNLETFLEKNLIRKVDLGGNFTSYELSENHHHHIVCKKCGLVEDFNLYPNKCVIDRISKKILRSSSYFDRIMEHSFELFGVCRKCQD